MTDLRTVRPCALFLACLGLAGCAVFGGGGPQDSPRLDPVVAEPADPPAVEANPDESPDRLADRMRAGDYEGVLSVYAADSTLHADETATWYAGLAAATSGHPGHDLRRARTLFERLLADHPETRRRPEAELLVEMISREGELRSTIGRLDRELSQLKAIDLGQQPAADP